MDKQGNAPTQGQLRAIRQNDKAADGVFFYAVASTGIFCRPSCASRMPKEENIRVFATWQAAQQAGFRPCKRCRPHGARLPGEEWVRQAMQCMAQNLPKKWTLADLAEDCHGSPAQLHRLFKQHTGQTPQAYLKSLRQQKAKHLLETTALPVEEVGNRAGFPNASHFVKAFRQAVGQTPLQYRKQQAQKGEAYANHH